MNKKNLLLVLCGFSIWGFQPLFWGLLHTEPFFMNAMRIVWSVVLTVGMLACLRRLKNLWALFRDWKKMRFMIPAALAMLGDWSVYIWAVDAGRVVDVSLGYFMNPLVVMLFSVLIFKERVRPLQLAAIALAVTGVAISAVQYGHVPLISIALALLAAIYSPLKKLANVEPIESIAAESLMMLPFALFWLVFPYAGQIFTLSAIEHLLFAIGGVVTAAPMVFFSVGIRNFPLLMLGFCQYISPSLSLVSGLILGETVTPDKLVTFGFVWAGIAVYMAHLIREERKRRREPMAEPGV